MSENRWNAYMKLLHEQLEQHGNSILDGLVGDNPHDEFAGKLYLIASAEIAEFERKLQHLYGTMNAIAYRIVDGATGRDMTPIERDVLEMVSGKDIPDYRAERDTYKAQVERLVEGLMAIKPFVEEDEKFGYVTMEYMNAMKQMNDVLAECEKGASRE